MEDLNHFYSQLSKTPPRVSPTVDVSISNNPIMNRDVLKTKLLDLDSIMDYDLTNLIKTCIDQICSDILNQDNFYITLIQNHKFLDSFTKAISSIPIDNTRRLCVNKLTYDYLTLADKGDEYVKHRFVNLCAMINKVAIDRLIDLGIDMSTAVNMAMSRYSSMSEIVNVKRLNFVICNKDPEIMTEQMIIYIYEKLFNRITPLFEGAMFEYYTDEEADTLGDSFMTIYSAVSLAVLTILNNMTSIDIKKVLIGYSGKWFFEGKPMVRFSLHALSGDFDRINAVVDSLSKENVYLP
jgi:hypothetical protein